MDIKTIIKRNGKEDVFDPSHLTKWAEWASVVGVDWFSVVTDAYKRCPDKCTTIDLHKAMIDACLTQETTPYLKMAGRLLIGDAYKQAFGGHDKIPSLLSFYKKMLSTGYYEDMKYSDEELMYLNNIIHHEKDKQFIYSACKQYLDRYCISDKVNNKLVETPQFCIMRVAMGAMKDEPIDSRVKDVEQLYNYISSGYINVPTPMMVNLGTPKKGLASCCVYTTDDSIGSLAAGDHIAYMMTCNSAGIGSYLKTRSKGDGVRNNTIKHLGKLPYYKMLESSVGANLQNGRGGAATVYFTCHDPEIMDLLALKNPTTVAQKQIRGIDYSFSYNGKFLDHVKKNKEWMLISYKDAPDLIEAMYEETMTNYNKLYDKYDKDSNVKKQYVNARTIMKCYANNRFATGRVYKTCVDNMNSHTPFKGKIYSSNLCMEISLPTSPFSHINELYKESGDGEIAMCSLAAIVVSNTPREEYEDVAYYTLKMIDNTIDMMDYPFPALKTTAQARRSVGVGITGLATYLAKNFEMYSSVTGKTLIHQLAELHMYSLIKASVKLAMERGKCSWYDKTKWSDGWLPIDTYNKNVDRVCDNTLQLDWEALRSLVGRFGMRHSVVSAMMPCESSSMASNSTNGLYTIS